MGTEREKQNIKRAQPPVIPVASRGSGKKMGEVACETKTRQEEMRKRTSTAPGLVFEKRLEKSNFHEGGNESKKYLDSEVVDFTMVGPFLT